LPVPKFLWILEWAVFLEANILKIVEIDKNSENQRFDKFLMKYFNKAGKSFIYKMLRKKRIKYNGKKAIGNEILKNGDLIQMYLSQETINSFMESKPVIKTNRDFSIIYEDQNIIICNKAAGISSQRDSSGRESLNDQLLFYLYENGEYEPALESAFTPSICNRLDKNTSGIVLFGKNFSAVQCLNRIIRERKMDKLYLTVLNGVIDERGCLEAYHLKNEKNKAEVFSEFIEGGKKIVTYYERIAENSHFSFVCADILTGKFHQIRAGFDFLGHSVIGDKKYGNFKTNVFFKKNYDLDNQFLHSCKLVLKDGFGFFDYIKGKEFIAPLDEKKKKIIYDLFGIYHFDIAKELSQFERRKSL